jgi:hypothetical protein
MAEAGQIYIRKIKPACGIRPTGHISKAGKKVLHEDETC